jgi:hypothetical protein
MANKNRFFKMDYDVVVVGGGPGGFGAAVNAARHGAKTALIQDRPVLGGNNSSEIRMHISGADQHHFRKNARESGIVEEIALRNRRFNPQNSFCVSDTIYWEMCQEEPSLDLYLNTRVTDVAMDNNHIKSAHGYQLSTEKEFDFTAKIFVDGTGDGFLGFIAGADFMRGREDKAVFGEPDAQDSPDEVTMGNSLMFTTIDLGHPVEFIKPAWANTYTEEDLKFRNHKNGETIWRAKAGTDSGYWWIELGGRVDDIISEGEIIRDNLLKALYGVWDHIKNGGDHNAENLALDWVGFVPGKRESRRLTGDYILVEQDLMESHRFNDAVAYGGWTLDRHDKSGIDCLYQPPAHLLNPPEPYQIPYRCYYSRNIDNLMMAGRNISCSHMAMSSTRVMATCMVGGQAVGTAASIAVREGISPRTVGEQYISELQQTLLRDDCYIPYLYNQDKNDLALNAKVYASSFEPGFEPGKVINGTLRNVNDDNNDNNLWKSAPLSPNGEWIRLDFVEKIEDGKIILRFDTDYNQEIFVSINKQQLMDQAAGVPITLVKDYHLELLQKDKVVEVIKVQNNYMRNRCHKFKDRSFDSLRLWVEKTNGDPSARVFEIRVYTDRRACLERGSF